MSFNLTTDVIAAEIFDQYDKDKNGYLDYKEVKFMLEDTYKGLNYTVKTEEISNFLKSYDLNHDGKISKQEYIQVVNKSMS